MAKSKPLIGLFEVCDPYEPPKMLGIFKNLKQICDIKKSKAWKSKKAVIYNHLCKEDGKDVYYDIEGKTPKLYIDKYSFGPTFYVEELTVGELLP